MLSEVTHFIKHVTVIYVTSFVPAQLLKVVLATHVPIILQTHYTTSSTRTVSTTDYYLLLRTDYASAIREQCYVSEPTEIKYSNFDCLFY